MDDQVPFKVYTYWEEGSKPEVRRFGVDKNVVTNFDYLHAKIQEVYPALKEKTFSISWQDEDGDEVKMSTDEEVLTMLNSLRESIVKLYVYVEKIQDGLDCHVIKASLSGHPEPMSSSQPGTHAGVRCDGCNSHVTGFRYKCITCVDFDLCASCEAQNVHPEHCVVRIPNPKLSLFVIKESIKKSRQFLKSIAINMHEESKRQKAERKAVIAQAQHCALKMDKQTVAKERREEKRQERREERHERHDERRERRDGSRPSRRSGGGWMEVFSKYVDQFANLAADHVRNTTEGGEQSSGQTSQRIPNLMNVDPADLEKMMNDCIISDNEESALLKLNQELNRLGEESQLLASGSQESTAAAGGDQGSATLQASTTQQAPTTPLIATAPQAPITPQVTTTLQAATAAQPTTQQAPTIQQTITNLQAAIASQKPITSQAPAQKAPAKKAPAQKAAQKAPAQQAPAQQAPAQQAPAQQAPAQQAPPQQAPIPSPEPTTQQLPPTPPANTPVATAEAADPKADAKSESGSISSAESISMSRGESPDKSAEEWTMINKEKDMDLETGVANQIPVDALPVEFCRPVLSKEQLYPTLNSATAVHDPNAAVEIPVRVEFARSAPSDVPPAQTQAATTQAPAAQAAAVKAAAVQAAAVKAAAQAAVAAQAFAPPPPTAQTCAAHGGPPPFIAYPVPGPRPAFLHHRYHHVPHIDAAIRHMIAMGFTNEGGWLTQLLVSKNGNIAAVLDLLTPVQPQK